MPFFNNSYSKKKENLIFLPYIYSMSYNEAGIQISPKLMASLTPFNAFHATDLMTVCRRFKGYRKRPMT